MAYKFQLGTFNSPGDIKLTDGADLSGSADVEVAKDVILNNDGVVYLNGDAGSVKVSSNGGSNLNLAGANIITNAASFQPEGDAGCDLGAVGKEFKDLFIDGVAYIDSLQADLLGAALDANSQAITNINVDSGVIDNTSIGATTRASGKFTTLSGSGALTVAGDITAKHSYITGYFMSASSGMAIAGNVVAKHGAIKGDHLSGSGALYLGASSVMSVSGNVFLPDNSITNDNLAGSIVNSKLANSSITLSQGAGMAAMGAVSLGGSVTVAVDGVLANLDTLGAPGVDGQFIVATGASAFAYESGATARTSLGLGTTDSPSFAGLTIAGNMSASGDLYVAGTLTSVNTDELVIKDKTVTIGSGSASKAAAAGSAVRFSYAADLSDYFELVYLQNGSGDASASGDILVARDESGALIDFQAANIYGTVTGDIVQNIHSIADAAGTLEVGFNYGSATLTGNVVWTLPASPTIGQVVNVKAPGSLAGFAIAVTRAGTQTIDGETSVSLASDLGAVSLMYVADNLWRIF
tara:strand:+ start:694 stop:2265 length:1572 start_codon:yes stop_codon:yes gene_type:complete